MSDFISRLAEFMKRQGINDNQMTVSAGLSVGLLGKAKSGGKGMSSNNIEKILSVYPDLSAEWLMTGEGAMLKSEKTNDYIDLSNENIVIETRPRIPLDAAAGALSVIIQSVSEAQCEKLPVISRFPQYDFTIMVKGDSMEPEFHSGDEIACRFIDEPSFIQWGRPHVLDTSQGVVLKRIYDRHDTILCRSDNNFYEDFEIPKKDIFHIALVVGSVRLF